MTGWRRGTGRRIYRARTGGRGGVNWVDLIVIGVVVVSGLAAFARGLVREVLAIGAWIGAGFFAVWAAPFVADRFLHWFGPDFGRMAALRGHVRGGAGRAVGAVLDDRRPGADVGARPPSIARSAWFSAWRGVSF